MKRYEGQPITQKIVIGPMRIRTKSHSVADGISEYADDVQIQILALEQALAAADKELCLLQQEALHKFGQEAAQIPQAQRMILQDEELLQEIKRNILGQKQSAFWAVKTVCDRWTVLFAAMEDDYIQARALDLRDVCSRIQRILHPQASDEDSSLADGTGKRQDIPSILVVEELSPSEALQLQRDHLLGLIMTEGSVTSHTAILAKAMNIPAILVKDMEVGSWVEGKLAVIDGLEGCFFVDPDCKTLEKYQDIMEQMQEQEEVLLQYKSCETKTKDGHCMKVYANAGNLDDVEAALENGAEGIGLFRSEFLYLGQTQLPTEEEQFQVYKRVLQKMGDKPVIIRTMDIGSDKQIAIPVTGKEPNPALGMRGIRLCLTNKALFLVQIRALLRAAAWGNLSIMYPMIISEKEIDAVQEIVMSAADQLQKEGIPYEIPKQGIMIETPAAACISDQLASKVDFFSIGTNDLTQYTLAIDRNISGMEVFADCYSPCHPAVMKLIQMTVENAHQAGIEVGICGELGANIKITQDLLALGIDEISVVPGMVLTLKKTICEIS